MYSRAIGSNGLEMCPCCGYATLEQGADFEVCDICFWEDDGQDFLEIKSDIQEYGSPNGVSLETARKNYIEFGAAERKDLEHVRKVTEKDERLYDFSKRNNASQ